MNNLCKQYTSSVKELFPIMGKAEKRYILSLKEDINAYCEEENIETLDKLYEKYGSPNNIVNSYFSVSDTTEIIKRIRISKWIKCAIVILLVIIMLGTLIWGIKTYNTFQTFKQEQAIFTDTIIEW